MSAQLNDACIRAEEKLKVEAGEMRMVKGVCTMRPAKPIKEEVIFEAAETRNCMIANSINTLKVENHIPYILVNVCNLSSHPIFIQKDQLLGRIQPIAKVCTTLPTNTRMKETDKDLVKKETILKEIDCMVETADKGLMPSQKTALKKILTQNINRFSPQITPNPIARMKEIRHQG